MITVRVTDFAYFGHTLGDPRHEAVFIRKASDTLRAIVPLSTRGRLSVTPIISHRVAHLACAGLSTDGGIRVPAISVRDTLNAPASVRVLYTEFGRAFAPIVSEQVAEKTVARDTFSES